jgi:hypothetical protein
MYIFQQDGATSSRTSNVTQEHLDEEVPEFIKKDEWSPDCNPMDYHVHCGTHSWRKFIGAALKNSLREELEANDN